MYKDPIVAEVRKVRKKIESQFGNDLNKFYEYMMEYQKTISNKVVTHPLKK
ncbi:MAG: hypothetical protein AABZ14_04905 [Candidatus Margulisiibacteriota bacterium]